MLLERQQEWCRSKATRNQYRIRVTKWMENSKEKSRILQSRYPFLTLVVYQIQLSRSQIIHSQTRSNNWLNRKVSINGRWTFQSCPSLQQLFFIPHRRTRRMMIVGENMRNRTKITIIQSTDKLLVEIFLFV